MTTIPVTLVYGQLGAGKTSYLGEVLPNRPGRTVVLVNEFGDEPLDHYAIVPIVEDMRVVSGGCMCCVKRQEFLDAARRLLEEVEDGRARCDELLIETSGVADPVSLAFSFGADPMLKHHFELRRMVNVLDAHRFGQLDDANSAGHRQLAVADEVVLAKVDRYDGDVDAVVTAVRALNPLAGISLMSRRAHRAQLERVLDAAQPHGAAARPDRRIAGGSNPITGVPSHGELRSVSIGSTAPVGWASFSVWLSMLLHRYGEHVLRMKGRLDVGSGGPVQVSSVEHIVHPPEHLPGWETGVTPGSEIVMILDGLDPELVTRSFWAVQGLELRAGAKGDDGS